MRTRLADAVKLCGALFEGRGHAPQGAVEHLSGERLEQARLERKIDRETKFGPLKYLHNEWRFTPVANGGTELCFAVDFAFKSRLFETLAGQMFDRALRRMTSAFEQRADALYGISNSSAQSAA